MIWLLHPSHRKFIKTLYKKVGPHGYIVITKYDLEAQEDLWAKTTNSKRRHQCIYRIIFKAINRVSESVDKEQIWKMITVKAIETWLRRIELKSPIITIRNTILYPILKYYRH